MPTSLACRVRGIQLLLLIMVLASVGTGAEQERERLSVSPGVQWRRLRAYPYVSSFPLVLTREWASSRQLKRALDRAAEPLLVVQLDTVLTKYLGEFTLDDLLENTDKTQKVVKNYTEEAAYLFREKTQQTDLVQEIMREVSKVLGLNEKTLNTLESIVVGRLSQMLLQQSLTLDQTRSFSIEMACHRNIIPMSLISTDVFQSELEKLSKKELTKAGYTLAIPITNIFEYYFMTIAECFLKDETITVVVKIPIIPVTDVSYELWKPIVIPFALQDQTCQVDILEDTVVAKLGTELKLVTGYEAKRCEEGMSPICKIPLNKNYWFEDATEKCLNAIQADASIENIRIACALSCKKGARAEVTIVSPSEVAVSHALPPLQMSCHGHSEVTVNIPVAEPRLGAVLLRPSCGCFLQSADRLLSYWADFCDNDEAPEPDPQAVHLIPAAWTIFNDVSISDANKKLENVRSVHDIVPENWETALPKFYFQRQQYLDPYETCSQLEDLNTTPYSDYENVAGALLLVCLVAFVAYAVWINIKYHVSNYRRLRGGSAAGIETVEGASTPAAPNSPADSDVLHFPTPESK